MNNSVDILGLIPARGGSKSVPRKNIKSLAGEPLITYSIRAALASQYITRVIVSTEDKEIADIARGYYAEVPFLRPVELAEDNVTDLPVFQHCLTWLREHENYHPDIVAHLRPTAPLRTSLNIDQGIEILLDSPEVDTVRSVCPVGQHPLKMWKIKENLLTPFVPEQVYKIFESYNEPRQKLPDAFIQNGSVDVIRTKVILAMNSMTGKNIKPLVMDELDSVNIDSILDWHLAEILMKSRANHNTPERVKSVDDLR